MTHSYTALHFHKTLWSIVTCNAQETSSAHLVSQALSHGVSCKVTGALCGAEGVVRDILAQEVSHKP